MRGNAAVDGIESVTGDEKNINVRYKPTESEGQKDWADAQQNIEFFHGGEYAGKRHNIETLTNNPSRIENGEFVLFNNHRIVEGIFPRKGSHSTRQMNNPL